MKRRELLRYPERNGCVLIKEGGRHSKWLNRADISKQSTVPRHTEIDDYLARRDLQATRLAAPKIVVQSVMIGFWATYCVPCIKETPTFNKINDEYASRGVVVLGVAMDEENAARLVTSFLKAHPMKYRVALGSEKAGERFKIEQMPTTVVFDRNGKEIKRFEGLTPEDALESTVKAQRGYGQPLHPDCAELRASQWRRTSEEFWDLAGRKPALQS